MKKALEGELSCFKTLNVVTIDIKNMSKTSGAKTQEKFLLTSELLTEFKMICQLKKMKANTPMSTFKSFSEFFISSWDRFLCGLIFK